LRVFVAAFVFACVTVVVTWPVFSRPASAVYTGSRVADAPWLRFLANTSGPAQEQAQKTTGWGVLSVVDTLRSVYTLTWWTHALTGGAPSLLDANMFYPLPRSLTYGDLQLGVVPWFAPIYLTTANPVLAYQAALFAGMVACAVAFFVLVRRWTGSSAAGLVAGIMSIVAPSRLHSMPIVYSHLLVYLPLALLCVDALVTGRHALIAAIGLAMCLVLESTCSAYFAYTAFLLVPVYTLGVLMETRSTRGVAPMMVAGLAAGAIVALVYRPFLTHVSEGVFGSASEGSPTYNPWFALLWTIPGENLRQHFVEAFGLPGLLVAALGLLERRSPRRWTVLGIVLVGALLALGPSVRMGSLTVSHLPWEWLAMLVPGFTAQRHPFVSITMVHVGLVCLAGFGTAWLARRARDRRAWTLAALGLGAWAVATYGARLRSTRPVEVATSARVPAVYRWLAAHGEGRPLLELPNPVFMNAVYVYYSTYHWLPIFNGTAAVPPPGYPELNDQAHAVLESGPEAAAFLRAVPVEWVLVHDRLLDPDARARLASPPPHLEEAARFDGDVLFRVRHGAAQ
jgi:hypothetical protein